MRLAAPHEREKARAGFIVWTGEVTLTAAKANNKNDETKSWVLVFYSCRHMLDLIGDLAGIRIGTKNKVLGVGMSSDGKHFGLCCVCVSVYNRP